MLIRYDEQRRLFGQIGVKAWNREGTAVAKVPTNKIYNVLERYTQ